ncbi:MAG: threonylcarbamoyl-AMP synthase [Azospirillum sp.]|nr:threonylcarbamoyl-AMP synthase [Azospirillum sp.]
MPRPDIQPPSSAAVARACDLLRAGDLVAFPTETVYGLGADATSDHAISALFAAKGRPEFNPLIVHVADAAAAAEVASFDARATLLASAFWAGPLTLVVPRLPGSPLSSLVSAGLETVGVRVPGHPVARALLKAVGRPIAAASANRSGGVSPTAPMHVGESLGERVAMILAGGRCPIGIESTVLDASRDRLVLLRPGSVSVGEIESVAGPVEVPDRDPERPQSPGQLSRHYAPSIPVRLNATSVGSDEALLAFGPDGLIRGGVARVNLSPQGDLYEAANNLFAMLRGLDKPGHASIAVMTIPAQGIGIAINDRLRRAATAP